MPNDVAMPLSFKVFIVRGGRIKFGHRVARKSGLSWSSAVGMDRLPSVPARVCRVASALAGILDIPRRFAAAGFVSVSGRGEIDYPHRNSRPWAPELMGN